LEAAQLYFSRNQQVDYIEVVTDNADEVGQPKREIQQYLHAHNLNYRIESWQERYGEFLGVLDVEKTVMFIILFLIIIVASFNIISSQIMMVKDKRQEIGILRTLGATKRSILSIFLINGASTGILGVGTGFILGVLFVENIERIRQGVQSILGTELFPDTFYFLSQLPAVLDWKQVLLIVGVAFGLSLLASLYPAWRAARLDPVQVLRYE
jgi:lipoprotein-releasing system permease protein